MVETELMGVSAGMRIAVSSLVGAGAALVAILLDAALIAPAIGWDAGALTFLVWTWLTIGPMSAQDTAAHATREDPSRTVSDVVLIAALSSAWPRSASSWCRPARSKALRKTCWPASA